MAAAAVKKPWIAWNMTEDEWIAAEKAADDAVNKEHAEAEEAMQKWFADNADQVAQVKEQMEADRIDKNKAKAFDKKTDRAAAAVERKFENEKKRKAEKDAEKAEGVRAAKEARAQAAANAAAVDPDGTIPIRAADAPVGEAGGAAGGGAGGVAGEGAGGAAN